MNAQLLAHSGFYNPEGRGEYAGCPLKFSNYGGLHFISYSTTIARVVNDRNGNQVTLVSDYNYSHTTAKHLSYIRGASPYPVVFVPNCEIADMVYIFRNKLEPYQKVEMDDDRYYQYLDDYLYYFIDDEEQTNCCFSLSLYSLFSNAPSRQEK